MWLPITLLCLIGAVCAVCTPIAQAQTGGATGAGRALSPSGTLPPASDAQARQVKADLQRILRGREFQPDSRRENPIARFVKWLRRQWERLQKWWSSLFQSGGIRGGGTALTYTLVSLLLAGLLWVMWHLWQDRPPRRVREAAARRREVQEEAIPMLRRDPGEWQQEAERMAAQGDYRRAYRALFAALLLRLDAAGVLSWDEARTNGDYLTALATIPQHTALWRQLAPLADHFDRLWYGEQTASEADYRTLLDAYQPYSSAAVLSATASPSAGSASAAAQAMSAAGRWPDGSVQQSAADAREAK